MKHLHIISFDIPYPPNYGGVIDVFYKLKALCEAGVAVTLHCFEYGERTKQQELEKYCIEVHYYKRKKNIVNPFKKKKPYIVSSRKDEELLTNLCRDNSPILFEGVHTTYYINHEKLHGRFKMLRMHNVEHDYYANIAKLEKNPFKKFFFKNEAARLKKYEATLKVADLILAISPNDFTYFTTKFEQVKYLPAFHQNDTVTITKPGLGDYCFYHGKLSVAENDEAARFLAEQVFNDMLVPFIIAGNQPSKELRKSVSMHSNITLLDDLDTPEINDYIGNAQVNVVPTFQPTGIKLKLLNVLCMGRHVLANKFMIANTGLEDLCNLANTAKEFKVKIQELMNKPFDKAMAEKRQTALIEKFNNKMNAVELVKLVRW